LRARPTALNYSGVRPCASDAVAILRGASWKARRRAAEGAIGLRREKRTRGQGAAKLERTPLRRSPDERRVEGKTLRESCPRSATLVGALRRIARIVVGRAYEGVERGSHPATDPCALRSDVQSPFAFYRAAAAAAYWLAHLFG
jgi:hypothetical protein